MRLDHARSHAACRSSAAFSTRDMRAFLTDIARSAMKLGPVYGMPPAPSALHRAGGRGGQPLPRPAGHEALPLLRVLERLQRLVRRCAVPPAQRRRLAEHAAFRRHVEAGYSREYAVEHMGGMIEIARRERRRGRQNVRPAAVPALQRIVTDQVGTLVAAYAASDTTTTGPLLHGLLSATVVPRPYALVAFASAAPRRRWPSSITKSSSAIPARCGSGTAPRRT